MQTATASSTKANSHHSWQSNISLHSFRMMLTITSEKDMLESFKIFDSKHEKGITFQGLKDVLTKMG